MCQKPVRFASIVLFFMSLAYISCTSFSTPEIRKSIDLSGKWQFQLDSLDVGNQENWHLKSLDDTVLLPGSLDESQKGFLNKDTTEMHLNRIYTYEGPAWFKKEVIIPESWSGSHIDLTMERTKVTHVWIDSSYVGTDNTIFSHQVYNVSEYLKPGRHTLTIQVDNNIRLVPVEGSHAYEDHTQTNWNGVLGDFTLEASNQVRIHKIKTTPNVDKKEVTVDVQLINDLKENVQLDLVLNAESRNSKQKHQIDDLTTPIHFVCKDTMIQIIYPLGDDVQLWSEFNPSFYHLNIQLVQVEKVIDQQSVDFGMRDFHTDGTQFKINDKITFLRGKQDACVFPLTGYPPMEIDGWIKVFKTAREYGLNHYRYHSWTPPGSAFEAADQLGIYLQPELPIWWNFKAEDPDQVAFMMKEGKKILDRYGNHPSFVMFALGNEIHQDRKVLQKMVAEFREYDDRPLYAQGSNNLLFNPSYAEGDDYWTTFRTAKSREDRSSDVRASISFLDSKSGGIINWAYPSTMWNYEKAIEECPVPVIGHEIGQYQIYPNYNEMEKYTGVVRPWNFEIFRQRLKAKGMLDQADDFFRATGAVSVLCYREDMEMTFRTPGFGGFQLLDLQDFPGQGTALVGILDAFMESKGLITPEDFCDFNDEIVLLLEMEKYCWQNDETWQAEIKISNYSSDDLKNKNLEWNLVSESGEEIAQGNLEVVSADQGSVTSVGDISVSLDRIEKSSKAFVQLKITGTEFDKSYPIWIYPVINKVQIPDGLIVSKQLDEKTLRTLENGGRVLLFPDLEEIEDNSVPGMFMPDFWNYGMFKSLAETYGGDVSPGTLGILTKPNHPIFNNFPTENHTNWQWWTMMKNSRPIILDDTDHEYRPVVQIIDNINRNHKLGMICEMKVGKGKLLICASDLPSIEKPEAKQLYQSLVNYMVSVNFDPKYEITEIALSKLLYQ